MKNLFFLFSISFFIFSCKENAPTTVFKKYDETAEIAAQQNHSNSRMQFKLIQSKFLDMNNVFAPFQEELTNFSEATYNKLKPLILEQDIPTIQAHVANGILSYEKLTLFYLYRIRKFESDSTKLLNGIIALNPDVLKEARLKDLEKKENSAYSIFGMPILLKDNINTNNMPTTAGAIALAENINTKDAFIVEKLRENGALILGKANLSEWAYFFCSGCPIGYSAVGGQTLNPYGRKVFETGGSSSGSGVTVAANFAVAAVGTETSGSITSPASQNSVVGLKPTIGMLSRTGIVPISSTLDTPGPMTKNVIDNAIFLQAMLGYDAEDTASVTKNFRNKEFEKSILIATLKGKRFGVLKGLLENEVYKAVIEKMQAAGAKMVEISPKREAFKGFITLLNIDMKYDLPAYLATYGDKNIGFKSVKDVTLFNLKQVDLRAPYGQQLFDGILKDTTTLEELELIKEDLQTVGKTFLQDLFDKDLDAILSINNYHSGISAVAEFPNLSVPMGYKKNGEPISLTFVGKPFSEHILLELGYAFEQITKVRKAPELYK